MLTKSLLTRTQFSVSKKIRNTQILTLRTRRPRTTYNARAVAKIPKSIRRPVIVCQRREYRGAEGARIEAPKPPNGVSNGEGVFPPQPTTGSGERHEFS